jgi:hypothetical protein
MFKLSSKKLLLSFLSLLFIIQISAQEKKYQVAIVAFYNLENLYDTLNDPNINDEEFTPEGGNRWTGERYKIKLNNMASVIARIGESTLKGGPAIIGVSEIENISVLNDLVNTEPLKSLNYGIVQYDSPDKRGVDVGFLYQKNRFKVLDSKPFPLTMKDTTFFTRDQLLVHGLLDNEEIFVLVNHWPSRSGGEKRSAPKRIAAAQLSRRIADSLMAINPKVKMFIMGDLNDDPTDASLVKHLKAKGDVKEVKEKDLFNPMYKLHKEGIGSLAYQDSWNLFDQIIISYGLTDKDFSSYKFFGARIFNEDFLKQKSGAYAGYPFRTFVGGQFTGGYSDHFPSYLILAREIK